MGDARGSAKQGVLEGIAIAHTLIQAEMKRLVLFQAIGRDAFNLGISVNS